MTTGSRAEGSRGVGAGPLRRPVHVLVTTAACAVAFALTGCAGSGEGVRVEGPSEIPGAQARADAQEEATGETVGETRGETRGQTRAQTRGQTRGDTAGKTTGRNVDADVGAMPLPAFDGVRVNVTEGQTVSVPLPISVTFAHPVPQSARAAVEGQLKVTTMDVGAEGSWSWVTGRPLADGQRVDFRPLTPWKPGTKVTVHVGAGLTRHFTVGRSLIAADAPGH